MMSPVFTTFLTTSDPAIVPPHDEREHEPRVQDEERQRRQHDGDDYYDRASQVNGSVHGSSRYGGH